MRDGGMPQRVGRNAAIRQPGFKHPTPRVGDGFGMARFRARWEQPWAIASSRAQILLQKLSKLLRHGDIPCARFCGREVNHGAGEVNVLTSQRQHLAKAHRAWLAL